jgi:hypothetical protein
LILDLDLFFLLNAIFAVAAPQLPDKFAKHAAFTLYVIPHGHVCRRSGQVA